MEDGGFLWCVCNQVLTDMPSLVWHLGIGVGVEEKSWELLRNKTGASRGSQTGTSACRIQDNGSRVPAHRLRKLRQ